MLAVAEQESRWGRRHSEMEAKGKEQSKKSTGEKGCRINNEEKKKFASK